MTATSLFLAGSAFNLLGRGTLYSSDEDSDYLRANAADGDPATPFRYGSIQANGWLKCDLNHVQNGDMETFTGPTPTGWVASNAGSGFTSQSLTAPNGGLGALRCQTTAAGGSAGPVVAITARSGEARHLNAFLRSVSGTARMRLYNATTGKYLTAAGVWTDVVTDCMTENFASYLEHGLNYTVEDYATCRADTVTILIRCYVEGVSQDALFDDVCDYPGFNFFSLHDHNIEANCHLTWFHSDNDTAYTAIRKESPLQPSFYGVNVTMLFRRWVKFEQTGLPYAAAGSWGELVLGQTQTLLTDARHPSIGSWHWDYVRPQVVSVGLTGKRRVSNLTNHRQRVLTMPYFAGTDASYTQFRDEIMGRCDDGAHPLVLVPNDSKPAVIFGEIPSASSDRQGVTPDAHEYELTVTEMPFGLSGL